jgi:hypothetical protein
MEKPNSFGLRYVSYSNSKEINDKRIGSAPDLKNAEAPFGLDGFGDQAEHTSRAQRSF